MSYRGKGSLDIPNVDLLTYLYGENLGCPKKKYHRRKLAYRRVFPH